jgi:uncharacterized membrane protein YgcG
MRKVVFLLLFTLALFGEHIANYNTNLVVNSNSKVYVKESILWDFGYNSRHGIYRDIPKNELRIKNLKVFQNSAPATFKLMDKGDFWRIRIGSGNAYVSGKVEYTIKYNLIGEVVRNRGDKNYIIVDLIGNGFKKPISYASAKVYLPKVLQNRVSARAFKGKFGSTNEIAVRNLGDTLEIKAKNLAPYEGLTLSVAFNPKLLAVGQKPSDKYWQKPIYYLFLAPIFALFYFFAKHFNVFRDIGAISPKYRPPTDLTVMEAGLIKDNFVDFSEIKPAILELANLGYLKIEEDENGLYLKKLRAPDSSLSVEQIEILESIFGYAEVTDIGSIKVDSSLFESIKAKLHHNLVQKGYYSTSVKRARESFTFAAVAVALLSIGAFFYYVFDDTVDEMIVPIGVSVAFILVGIFNFVGALRGKDFSGLMFFTMWIGFSSLFLYTILGSKDILISLLLMLGVIAAGSYFIYKKLDTLTLKGVQAKWHLLGLKEFIDKADKDKIKFFLQEDSKYLDKMLPYAVLFGLNSHWLNLYQELETPLPTWYEGGYDSFSHMDFEPSVFNESNFIDSIPSSPSISSGDFGGFGDFGGGGFGGGGGDSW